MPASRTVLLVDDDAWVLDALALGLGDQGFAVTTACDVASAIAALSRLTPAAIITDLQMPPLADAVPALLLREHAPNTPILAISGSPHLSEIALANGADAFLRKPARAVQIADCLRLLLGQTQTGVVVAFR